MIQQDPLSILIFVLSWSFEPLKKNIKATMLEGWPDHIKRYKTVKRANSTLISILTFLFASRV